MFMADRIALMREGRVVQVGTPEQLYLHPREPFVATFLGEVNRMHALVRGGRAETAIGTVSATGLPDGPAELLLRPEGLLIRPAAEEGAAAPAVVEACRLLGSTTLVHLAVPDGAGGTQHLHARLPPGAALSRGQRVGLAVDPARAFVFRAVPS
jgi:iron(III) transport system ATP-binding protein